MLNEYPKYKSIPWLQVMVCCVIGCPNHGNRSNRRGANEKITFHMFPNPNHHQYRMQQWLDSCNNPKIRTRDPIIVYKQYRMCRLHFAQDCFNGACKRLLETAVPTLRLNLEPTKPPKPKGSITLQVDEPASVKPEYKTKYLEKATAAPTMMEDWRNYQPSNDENIDIEMKASDDEDIDEETENYIEVYEEDELFEAEDGKN